MHVLDRYAATTTEAQKVLASIPIYNNNTVGATAKGLKGVQFNWGGDPVLAFISKQ